MFGITLYTTLYCYFVCKKSRPVVRKTVTVFFFWIKGCCKWVHDVWHHSRYSLFKLNNSPCDLYNLDLVLSLPWIIRSVDENRCCSILSSSFSFILNHLGLHHIVSFGPSFAQNAFQHIFLFFNLKITTSSFYYFSLPLKSVYINHALLKKIY